MDYPYFSDGDLKEFIYILVKNLEANKIDMSILESRVLNDETLELLKDKKNYKEFITQVGNNLIEILKVKNENDQIDIHSFIKTFLYNNYIALEKQVPEEFKDKLLALFIGIVSIIVFLFTEDITLEMQLIDKWTIIMLLFFIDQLFATMIIHKVARGSKKDEQWRKQ